MDLIEYFNPDKFDELFTGRGAGALIPRGSSDLTAKISESDRHYSRHHGYESTTSIGLSLSSPAVAGDIGKANRSFVLTS
jgi:hypothetical protein